MTDTRQLPGVHERNVGVRTEEDVVQIRPVLWVLFTVTVISVLLSWWSERILTKAQAGLRPSGVYPERELSQTAEINEVEQALFLGDDQLRTSVEHRRQLERFQWVDKKERTVAIPIERAKELFIRHNARGRD